MSADIEREYSDQLRHAINAGRDQPQKMRVTMGRIVHVWGPWSNGHDEQSAIVTHAHGNGEMVNVFVFVDEGAPMQASEIPFYPTRAEAIAAMAAAQTGANIGGPLVAYFPDKA
jgi:hypothetical protein